MGKIIYRKTGPIFSKDFILQLAKLLKFTSGYNTVNWEFYRII